MEDINRIKLVLVEKKRTSKWLSDQLGVTPSTVSKWCTNSSQPDITNLLKIAGLLDVDIKELLVSEYKKNYLLPQEDKLCPLRTASMISVSVRAFILFIRFYTLCDKFSKIYRTFQNFFSIRLQINDFFVYWHRTSVKSEKVITGWFGKLLPGVVRPLNLY